MPFSIFKSYFPLITLTYQAPVALLEPIPPYQPSELLKSFCDILIFSSANSAVIVPSQKAYGQNNHLWVDLLPLLISIYPYTNTRPQSSYSSTPKTASVGFVTFVPHSSKVYPNSRHYLRGLT